MRGDGGDIWRVFWYQTEVWGMSEYVSELVSKQVKFESEYSNKQYFMLLVSEGSTSLKVVSVGLSLEKVA